MIAAPHKYIRRAGLLAAAIDLMRPNDQGIARDGDHNAEAIIRNGICDVQFCALTESVRNGWRWFHCDLVTVPYEPGRKRAADDHHRDEAERDPHPTAAVCRVGLGQWTFRWLATKWLQCGSKFGRRLKSLA